MALTDLANIDLLDLILAHSLSDKEKEELLDAYIQSYTVVIGNAVNRELKPEDHEAIDKLMADPQVTPEKMEKFYSDRIPHYQAKITLVALEFKKSFVLDVYKNKVEEYQTSDNKKGLAAWEQIYADAKADNWNEVARLLKIVEDMSASVTSTTTPSSI